MDTDRDPDSAYEIRPFTWDDLDALVDARAAVTGDVPHDRPAALAQLRAEFEMPGAAPSANVFLAERDGRLTGCAVAHLEPAVGRAVGELGVVPEARGRGLGDALLHRLVRRASEAGARVFHMAAPERDGALRDLLVSAGLEHVRTYDTMQRPPGAAGELPALHGGLSLRRYVPGRDEPVLADLQNAAFEGAWGFAPNTPEEIRAYVAMRGTRPEDILFAVDDASGTDLGYIWTGVEAGPDGLSGTIAMTGVRPAARGRGTGSAIIGAGVRHVLERGAGAVNLEVDGSNDAAINIYRALGFRKTGENLWYEAKLPA